MCYRLENGKEEILILKLQIQLYFSGNMYRIKFL